MGLLLRRAFLRLRGLSFTARREVELPREVIARLDAAWAAALGFALVDPIRGSSFQAQHLLLSLEAGEPYRVLRSFTFEASFLATGGLQNQARVEALLARAEELAGGIEDPHVRGLVDYARGIACHAIDRWSRCLDAFGRAEVIFRDKCPGTHWERSTIATCLAWDLWLLGDLEELARRVPAYLREAESRGDRYLVANLRNASTFYWLLFHDDPARALREAAAAAGAWTTDLRDDRCSATVPSNHQSRRRALHRGP